MTLTLVGIQAQASALADSNALIGKQTIDLLKLQPNLRAVADRDTTPPAKPAAPTPPQSVQYTVAPGDNLTKIAADHGTSWIRIWNNNGSLTNPDLIFPGQVFLIPPNSMELTDRAIPAAVLTQMTPAAATRGVVAGNGYDPGNCTWYVKNRRADLPNNLGNANTWSSQAALQGFTEGSTPRAGAVGASTRGAEGHVVFVESVNADGSANISEMNYAGLYSLRTRVAAASEFTYIY